MTKERLRRVNELSEARLWKSLDNISERLGTIEKQLSEMVRLEEKVSNQEQVISRYGNRLDNHDKRLHETEIWQASYGDRSSFIKKDIRELKEKIEDIEYSRNVNKGHKDIGKEILKWITGILAGILIYTVTRGN